MLQAIKRAPEALIFLSFLGLYVLSLAPDVTWGGGDSPRLALAVHDLALGYDPTAHPIYVLVAKAWSILVPCGSLPWKLNLLSAVAGSAALVIFYRACTRLCRDRFFVVLACLALGLSHTFWTLSVITEVYTFDLLFILGLTLLILRWVERPTRRALYGLCFLLGLGTADHLMVLLVGPALLVALAGKILQGDFRPGAAGLALAALSFLLGLSPVLVIILATMPAGFGACDLSAAFAAFLNLQALRPLSPEGAADLRDHLHFQWDAPAELVLLVGLNFVGVSCFAGLAGLAQSIRRMSLKSAVVITATGFLYLFALLHPVVDTYQFCLAGHATGALLLPAGFEWLLSVIGRHTRAGAGTTKRVVLLLVLLTPPLIYAGLPLASKGLGVSLFNARSLPHRDNAWYFLFPPKTMDRGARQYIDESFAQAAGGAAIIGDFTPAMLLAYASQAEGNRPDVEVVTVLGNVDRHFEEIEKRLGERPVFVAGAQGSASTVSRRWYVFEDDLRKRYEVREKRPLLEIVGRGNGGGTVAPPRRGR